MIGEGDDKNYIDNFIAKHHINAITLPPKENIFDYYDIIDIVVLPSRVEPFGIVAIEAGIMKKPLIASDADGLKEIIDNGKSGILVETGNIGSLTDSLRILMAKPELRNRLGEELYNKVVNNFTSNEIIPLYKQTYQQLMKNYR
jgi:glycosyltransferase involved in cell wall biosynthesis